MRSIVVAFTLFAAAPPALAQGAAPVDMTQVTTVTGVVKSIDPKASTVLIKHEAIPSLRMPGMTMDFKASPALLRTLKVGQKITFQMRVEGVPEIVSLTKAKAKAAR